MHAKTVKRAKKIKIKLDKLNMATTRKTVRQILFSNKKQIAKLTPKSPSGVVILSHPDIAATD